MKLDQMMKAQGMTAQKLSEVSGVNKRTIEAYRSGRREPSLRAGLKIAEALNVSPYDILEDEE